MNVKQKNHTISLKISSADKKALKEMAGNAGVTLSEFIRAKSLATLKGVVEEREVLKTKEKYISDLKIALTYYQPKSTGNFIILNLTARQKELLLKVFTNYYNDNKPIEKQLTRYLAEDIITPHYNLDVFKYTNDCFKRVDGYNITKTEKLFQGICEPGEIIEEFREYGVSEYTPLKQVKLTKRGQMR